MPKSNVIIAPIVRITPSVTKRGAEMLREAPAGGFSIDFEGKQTAKLLPIERAAAILEILEGLRKLGAPAYIEYHPETKAITQLLIPQVSRVAAVSDVKGENVRVELEMSSAIHVLSRKAPDFEEMFKTAQAAMRDKKLMIVTETDKHEIIDIRPYPDEYKTPVIPLPPPVLKEIPRKFRWWWPFCCCHPITEKKAVEMFNMVAATSCDPLTVPAPCIPFLYPDDGCWARAHEMYRLMLAAGVTSCKVWIYGSLATNTRNNPYCVVYWGWHVAPTVCVRYSCFLLWFFRRRKVIDPSLFSGPVTVSTWKSVQGDASASIVYTKGEIYYRSSGGYTETDPTYANTNYYLNYYRIRLQNRSLGPDGPPPYAHCP